ncbi:MAG TPA: hypothetical protein PK208_03655 [Fibrobacteria bacterium]|nr:hypothetical protein [Fibrobacteria bacterium]
MKVLALFLVPAALISGCASLFSSTTGADASGQCFAPSRIEASTFERVADSALEQFATRLPDSGGVRCALAYQLKAGKTATVYRVYGGKGWRFGRWWSFAPPSSDSLSYRKDYEICRAWNSLDSLAICALKVGSRFAIGPGQSAVCGNDPGYGTSDSLQVFFANPRDDLDTANCRFAPLTWER